MGIKQEIEHTKTLLNQGVDLLLLRLQVINLDLAEQAENVCIVAVMLLLWRIWSAWRRHNGLFADSLNGLRDDIACLRGELSESEAGHE